MRILVTGCAGMLGRAVMNELVDAHVVTGVDLPDGDLSSSDDVATLWSRANPEWVIHCAAYTDVDGAESDNAAAWSANRDATANLVAICARSGAGLTAVSTDYVFPGDVAAGYREDHPRNPVNAYGASKAAAEAVIESLSDRGQIVRTSWLFGPGPANFVLTIRRLLGERDILKVVDDQRGCPTYAPDLAVVLRFLAEDGQSGVYHATNTGACTWYEFAREIATGCGEDPARILRCTSAEFPTPARRPASSILLSTNLEQRGCPARRGWREALGHYLAWLAAQETGPREAT